MHKTYLFDMLSVDDELKSNIAEYYFSKKLYPQALELFEEMEKEGDSSAVMYQKIAYAYQQTSQLFSALEAYKKADLIQPDDFWTVRKMAMCYMLAGDHENALETYRHAHFIQPANLPVRLQIANCLMEQKKYDEALKNLLEIQQEHPDNQRVLRMLITGSLSARNPAQADYFASLLLETSGLTAYDYVISGHAAWSMQKNQEAKNHYNQTLTLLENNWEVFVDLFKQNKELLTTNEVDENEIPMILDAIRYNQPIDPVLV
jgi:tetratricopeptide (TPR) repeat protein